MYVCVVGINGVLLFLVDPAGAMGWVSPSLLPNVRTPYRTMLHASVPMTR